MKRLASVTLLASLLATSAFAQPHKGDWALGLDIAPIAPKVGYFISDKFQVGTGINLSVAHSPAEKSGSFGLALMPYARYYFAKKGLQPRKLFLFAEVVTTARSSWSYDNRVNHSLLRFNHADVGIGPGAVYFINDKFSVDASVRYTAYNITTRTPAYSTRYSVGFQFYLTGKKKRKNTQD